VSYAPIIESNPNDMATVYTTMKKCIDMTKAVGQNHSIQTFDQQLYAIAKQVFIRSFSLHQLKNAANHNTRNVSYARVKARTARLNSFPFNMSSTVLDA
jgi:hypothetical protein